MSYVGLGATEAEVVAENAQRKAAYDLALAEWERTRSSNAKSCGMTSAAWAASEATERARAERAEAEYQKALTDYNAQVKFDEAQVKKATSLSSKYNNFAVPYRGCITQEQRGVYTAQCARAQTQIKGLGVFGALGALLTSAVKASVTEVKPASQQATKAAATSPTVMKAVQTQQANYKVQACGQKLLPICGAVPVKPKAPPAFVPGPKPTCAPDPPKPVLVLLEVTAAPPPVVSTPTKLPVPPAQPVPIAPPLPTKAPVAPAPPVVKAPPPTAPVLSPPVVLTSAPPGTQTIVPQNQFTVDLTRLPVRQEASPTLPPPPRNTPPPVTQKSGLGVVGVLALVALAGGAVYLATRKKKEAA